MGNIFDNWSESYAEGAKMGLLIQQIKRQQEQLEQQNALQILQTQEANEKLKKMRTDAENAQRIRDNYLQETPETLKQKFGDAGQLITNESLYQKAVEGILANANKQQQLNEAYILSLPDDNPMKMNFLSGKQKMGSNTAKPLNMEVAYDTLGASYFPDYATNPESQQKFNVLFQQKMSTPEGRKELVERRQAIVPPSITYLQTDKGFIPTVTRGAGAGTIGEPTGLKKPMPSEMVVAEQQIGTLLETAKAMREVYKPEYVGPFAGRYGGLREQTFGVDENQALFRSRVAQMNNTLVYLMSGKQINEQEYERLKKQMPNVNLPPSVFEARTKEFERTIESIIDNRRKNMGAYSSNSQENNSNQPNKRKAGETPEQYLKRISQ